MFRLLLPFSPLPLAPSAHAEEDLLPSYGPFGHESYPVHHLEGKKPILPRNPGDQSTLEPLMRPDTRDVEPFSAEPTSTQIHHGGPPSNQESGQEVAEETS